MTCGECGNTFPALDGFPKQVLCKHYKLHMSNKADASRCDYFEKKPITNADRIRSMTDEEIARTIGHGCPNDKMCDYMGKRITTKTCEKCWLDWLKEEANSGDVDSI